MAEAKIDLGRSDVAVKVAVPALLGLAVIVGVWSGLDATGLARVFGFAGALLFAVPLVMTLRALPQAMAPRYVILDQIGLRIEYGKEQIALEWQELVAVGIAFEEPPVGHPKLLTVIDDLKHLVKAYLIDSGAKALRLSGAREIALDVYPVSPEAPHRHPALQPYWQPNVVPPLPGLPAYGWRFPLPPVLSISQDIGQGVQLHQPSRWLGGYRRH